MLSVLLCCAAIFAVTSARPDGAPLQACDSLMPMGPHIANNNMEQATPTPWTIDICNFNEVGGVYQYTPGGTYNITLRAARDPTLTFRGLFIQGRTQGSNDMVGSFADPAGTNNDLTRLSSCIPANVGVTHNSNVDKNGSFVFTWTAPSAGAGPIWFRYTVVQNLTTFWADDSSAVIQEENNLTFEFFSGASNLQSVGFWTLLATAAGVALKALL